MTVYMMVTPDKYELPVYIADTVPELARIVGKNVNTIYSAISNAKKRGGKSVYVKVKVE